MAELYEVQPVEGLPPDATVAILTIEDPHRDDCPLTCTSHKHKRTQHTAGQTFDAAHLVAGTNIDALIYAGLIRKVEPKPVVADKAPKKDG